MLPADLATAVEILDESDPSDYEILDLLEVTFGMTRQQVIDRLSRIDLTEATNHIHKG